MADPRGIRMNNPGNIDRNGTAWKGMSTMQDDPRFCRFDEPRWGIRAMVRTIYTYFEKYHVSTIRGIISRWAPPSENNTESYIQHVSELSGIGPDDHIELPDDELMVNICKGITRHENGTPSDDRPPFWFDTAEFREGVELA